MPLSYVPLFDPTAGVAFDDARAHRIGDQTADPGPAGDVYAYSDTITLAVNVALAAGRPLLVRGLPGTGKTSLARSVADRLGWRYYATTVSSRTTARDLLWTFDTVRRLADAQADRLLDDDAYLMPGPIWWAFDAESAARRGAPPGAPPVLPDPGARPSERAVVLLDELDKADPDVPNDLLGPLGEFRFRRDGADDVVARHAPLVVVTSNDERDLPPAFLRRCVVLVLDEPGPVRVRLIAERHFPQLRGTPLLDDVLREYHRIREARPADRHGPSIAELLDALAASDGLRISPGSTSWTDLASLVLAKDTSPLGR